jgi:hypothetical protein
LPKDAAHHHSKQYHVQTQMFPETPRGLQDRNKIEIETQVDVGKFNLDYTQTEGAPPYYWKLQSILT